MDQHSGGTRHMGTYRRPPRVGPALCNWPRVDQPKMVGTISLPAAGTVRSPLTRNGSALSPHVAVHERVARVGWAKNYREGRSGCDGDTQCIGRVREKNDRLAVARLPPEGDEVPPAPVLAITRNPLYRKAKPHERHRGGWLQMRSSARWPSASPSGRPASANPSAHS
jgi:hypothetical protein